MVVIVAQRGDHSDAAQAHSYWYLVMADFDMVAFLAEGRKAFDQYMGEVLMPSGRTEAAPPPPPPPPAKGDEEKSKTPVHKVVKKDRKSKAAKETWLARKDRFVQK